MNPITHKDLPKNAELRLGGYKLYFKYYDKSRILFTSEKDDSSGKVPDMTLWLPDSSLFVSKTVRKQTFFIKFDEVEE